MKVWRDREGKWITFKEFRQRFSKGVEGITPIQQAKSNITGYCIIIVGAIWGAIFAAWYHQWWLVVILIGTLVIQGTALLSVFQRLIIIKNLEKLMK